MNDRTLFGLAPLFLLACSGGAVAHDEPATVIFEPAEPTPDGYLSSGSSRRSGWTPLGADGAEANLHGRLVVPPERALVRVRAVVSAESRTAVVGRVAEVASGLVERAEAERGCAVEVDDLSTAQATSNDDWRATATLTLSVSFRGRESVPSRHAHLEHCLSVITAAVGNLEGVEMRVGQPLVTIDDPETHRAVLLERALRPAAGTFDTAETGALPPQFDAMATRCRSTGAVVIVARSLSGVALAIDLDCGRPTAS